MPATQLSDYQPPYWLFNGHLQTIVPSQFRKVEGVSYQRERFSTPDKDFLLLDWSVKQSDKLVIISHGLEGDSHRPYIKGMVRAFNRAGWDALAWNFRGCGGEINHTLRFYHSGATDDLDLVIAHALSQKKYTSIVLVGFSLGGNLTLKYLGESGDRLIPEIKAGAVFSVPMDLYTCSVQISAPANFIYNRRFLRNLKLKVSQKVLTMPDELSTEYFSKIRNLKDFDDFYTAPLHGFKDAMEYYTHCSSLYYLNAIRIPTLIVNAQNDPFLSDKCYPADLLKDHAFVHLETPASGGHVGFMPRGAAADDNYWSEERATAFAERYL
ncbi:YheT family hydrolase [Catalinimonas niigatensis]|uniref:YheT family hydrolase n=1 Tax=Catalinimonas niigatensis TaxID=1397264 RepID=UPI0026660D9D|nr:alpha/beta fold hydrolase [Catalinimonas niigatensis]WPP50529.1 alpha/beta fold hydrolase [Catalinimonas niigatensis]